MSIKNGTGQQAEKEDKILFGAFTGICTVALIQILGVTNRDAPINIALYCFAIAIPLLAVKLYAVAIESTYEITIITWYMQSISFAGIAGAIVGILCIFWHFSWLVGITFLICGVAGVVGLFKFYYELEKQNKNKDS
jgi:hypothetical protein